MRIIAPFLVCAGLLGIGAPLLAQPAPLTVKITPTHASSATGTATITPNADGFTVTIKLSGQQGDNQEVELRKGGCGHLGDLAEKLSSLTAGTLTTNVTDMSMADLAKGPYAIQVLKSALSSVRTPYPDIACGDVKT